MKLSVVVIGLNEGPLLTHCLQSVKEMDYPAEDYELIYVDSSSTDDSLERAHRAGAKIFVVDDDKPNAAKGRNMGWRHAKGKFVLFLDGDTTIHPDFVAMALPYFAKPEVAIVYGKVKENHPEDSYYKRVHDIDWHYPIGEVSTCGGNTIIRVEALRKVDGFNPQLPAGEEPELCRRIKQSGFSILSLDIPMVSHNIGIETFSDYWKRCKRTGYGYACAVDQTCHTSNPLWLDRYRKNFIKTGVLSIWLAISLYFFFLRSQPLPLILLLAAILFLVGRTAWKIKQKGHGWATSVFYGIHSHFQHIPMFFGQCEFLVSKIKKS